ncbi:MAG: alpha/beta fold hydrolase [Succinivibrionaceae bacterium]|nr:alpha/beta fold hydrolase [Succinivibrionaceae bacterium]
MFADGNANSKKVLFQSILNDRSSAVVLLHGFLGSGSEWTEIAQMLRKRGRAHVLTPDLPGHGSSKIAPDRSLRLADFLPETKNFRKLLIWGYSMGGRIALEETAAWLKAPSDPPIAGLIIESSDPGLADEKEKRIRSERDEAWALRFERESLPQVLENWYNQEVFSSLSPERKEILIREKSAGDGGKLAAALRAYSVSGQRNHSGVFKSVPTIYLCGDLDRKYRAIAAKLAKDYPQLNVKAIENGDHNLHRFHAEELVKTVFEG